MKVEPRYFCGPNEYSYAPLDNCVDSLNAFIENPHVTMVLSKCQKILLLSGTNAIPINKAYFFKVKLH
jgi:hypothetical protein